MFRIIIYFLLTASVLLSQDNLDSLENFLNKNNPQNEERVDVFNRIAYLYYRVDSDSTLTIAQRANELANKLNYKFGLAESHRVIGIAYTFKGQYDNAVTAYNTAISYFQEINNKNGVMKIYNGLGVIQVFKGDFKAALDNYFKAQAMAEELNDKAYFGIVTNNIGEIYLKMNNYERALTYFNLQLPIFTSLGATTHIGITYLNLAETFMEMDSLEKSLKYANLGLQISIKNNFEPYYSPLYTVRGKVYEKLGEDDKALEEFLKALVDIDASDDVEYKWRPLVGIADYYFRKGDLRNAKIYIDRAMDTSEKTGVLEGSKESAYGLFNYYERQNDYRFAYKYLLLYKTLNDSLLSEANTAKITSLEMQAGFDRVKQIQADELDKQTLIAHFLGICILLLIVLAFVIYKGYRSQSKASAKLAELNSTKDKFFSIIAHDLRAPFNTLIGFSQMMAEEYEHMTREEILEFIKTIESVSKDSHQLLENLLSWARLQIDAIQINKIELPVYEAIESNIHLLKRLAAKKKIRLSYEASSEIKVKADKDMLDTVIRNLMSNSIKFTKQGGNIQAKALKSNGKVEIHIIDNGIGMDEETKDNLFKIDKKIVHLGTEKEKGTGLGLILCKEFIEKNEGKIRVESSLGLGSNFIIELPAI